MRIVIVGGAGIVGSLVTPVIAEHHDVVLADLSCPAWWTGTFVEADVTRPSDFDGVFAGADALIYMAMGPMENWETPDWAAKHFAVNVGGLYTTAHAAVAQGVRRIVHASSASVFDQYEQHPDATEPTATDGYGVSKTCGEEVLKALARLHPVTVVAIRMVQPRPDDVFLTTTDPELRYGTAGSDTARAYLAAVERQIEPGFHAVTMSGDPQWGVERQRRIKELLDWEPRVARTKPWPDPR